MRSSLYVKRLVRIGAVLFVLSAAGTLMYLGLAALDITGWWTPLPIGFGAALIAHLALSTDEQKRRSRETYLPLVVFALTVVFLLAGIASGGNPFTSLAYAQKRSRVHDDIRRGHPKCSGDAGGLLDVKEWYHFRPEEKGRETLTVTTEISGFRGRGCYVLHAEVGGFDHDSDFAVRRKNDLKNDLGQGLPRCDSTPSCPASQSCWSSEGVEPAGERNFAILSVVLAAEEFSGDALMLDQRYLRAADRVGAVYLDPEDFGLCELRSWSAEVTFSSGLVRLLDMEDVVPGREVQRECAACFRSSERSSSRRMNTESSAAIEVAKVSRSADSSGFTVKTSEGLKRPLVVYYQLLPDHAE